MHICDLQIRQRQWEVNTFEHALFHAAKAVGKLASHVDDMDHALARAGGVMKERRECFPPNGEKYVADLVICALKLAKEYPIDAFDLEALVVSRMREKGAL